jgi:hypothetical protein
MSGVSITSAGAGFDMDAIIAGGPDLLRRMADFKAQRDAAVQALADLQLGKSAAEARDALARDRAAFEEQKKAELDNLAKHVTSIKADTDTWRRETVAKSMADREAAAAERASAERAHSDAKAALAEANRKNSDADSRLADVTAKQLAFAQAAAVLSGAPL